MPNWRFPEFEWDEGNVDHIESRHDVLPEEAEQVFNNRTHIRRVGEFYEVLGRDDNGRYLLLVCIDRQNKIRVFSAREMTHVERRRYERHS